MPLRLEEQGVLDRPRHPVGELHRELDVVGPHLQAVGRVGQGERADQASHALQGNDQPRLGAEVADLVDQFRRQAELDHLLFGDLADRDRSAGPHGLGELRRRMVRPRDVLLEHLLDAAAAFGISVRRRVQLHARRVRPQVQDGVLAVVLDSQLQDRLQRLVVVDRVGEAPPGVGQHLQPKPARLGLRPRLALHGVHPRVVEPDGRPPRELLGDGELVLAVPPLRIARDERQRPEDPASRFEGDAHERTEPELHGDPVVLVVAGGVPKELGRHIGERLGHARPDHPRHRMLPLGKRRVPGSEQVGKSLFRRVAVNRGDAFDPAVRRPHVDQAQLREVPDHELRELGERRRIVER